MCGEGLEGGWVVGGEMGGCRRCGTCGYWHCVGVSVGLVVGIVVGLVIRVNRKRSCGDGIFVGIRL